MLKKLLFLSFILLLISPATLAYPKVFPSQAINGPTGLIRIPSADIIEYKNFNVGGSFGQSMPDGGATGESMVSYNMNIGAFHGLELGVVGGTDKNTKQMREGVFVNMKLSLSSGDDTYPLLLALGTENLFSYTQTDVYMVATKYFKQGPKATFGFMADFPNNRFRPMGIAGVEFPLADTFFLLADMMAGETLFQVNAGAKIYFTPIFSLTLSGINLLNGTQVKDARSAAIGFSWANPF
ncbi:MAG: hypothetical protein ABIH50_05925 [bacterium]